MAPGGKARGFSSGRLHGRSSRLLLRRRSRLAAGLRNDHRMYHNLLLSGGFGDPSGDVHFSSPTPISTGMTNQTGNLAGQGDLTVEGAIIQIVLVLKAWLAHHESASRCFDGNPDEQERLNRDSTVPMKRWRCLAKPTRPVAPTSVSTVGVPPWPCDQRRKSRGTTETYPTISSLHPRRIS